MIYRLIFSTVALFSLFSLQIPSYAATWRSNSGKTLIPNLDTNAGTAIVFNPPSNVRVIPNGAIVCSVRTAGSINIYNSVNGWYQTDVCGSMGYIHQSQIRF
jgi:hypothetical protein